MEMLLATALALGLGGLVKGATGMGLPLVALPILASFLGVQHSVALMCFPILFTNLWQVWRYRADMRAADFLSGMSLGGAAGILVGTWLITSVPERALSLVLALLLLAYIALTLVKPRMTIAPELGRRLAPGMGFGAGVLQGATGIGSPVSVTFIHSMRLHRTAHVFAVSSMFLMFTLVQIPALAVAGVLTWAIALQGMLAMAPAFLAMPVGNWLAGKLDQKAFDRLILGVLALVALQLAYAAIRG